MHSGGTEAAAVGSWQRVSALWVCLALAGSAVAQPVADHATMAPITSQSRIAASLHAMPQSEAADYLTSIGRVHVVDTFSGLNAVLRQEDSEFKMQRIGRGVALSWDSDTLFDVGSPDAGYTAYSAAIVSTDALGLRLQVDLSNLLPGDEVWVIDQTVPRAFGPFGLDDHVDDGRWLPSVEGDTAVLVARTTAAVRPELEVVGISHFYRNLSVVARELSCNINIACETDPALLSVATGVGIMVVPVGNGDAALCSGALVNNPDTSIFEPLYLTSWHCVPSASSAEQIDIIWDFRSTACNTDDPPTFAVLPRSNGVAVMATDNELDITLLELDNVPSGPYGRTFLGWETGTPQVNETLATIHFPDGEHMRISKGEVDGIDQSSGSFNLQTKVQWIEGVTEPGSSGSPLLLASSEYRVIGTLSNGPLHSCVDTAGNVDWYSSFRDFFPLAEPFLKSNGIEPPTTSGCAATKAFAGDPVTLERLRTFRDEVLAATAPGKLMIKMYYGASPFMARWVERSPMARSTFRTVAQPFAYAGSNLR